MIVAFESTVYACAEKEEQKIPMEEGCLNLLILQGWDEKELPHLGLIDAFQVVRLSDCTEY